MRMTSRCNVWSSTNLSRNACQKHAPTTGDIACVLQPAQLASFITRIPADLPWNLNLMNNHGLPTKYLPIILSLTNPSMLDHTSFCILILWSTASLICLGSNSSIWQQSICIVWHALHRPCRPYSSLARHFIFILCHRRPAYSQHLSSPILAIWSPTHCAVGRPQTPILRPSPGQSGSIFIDFSWQSSHPMIVVCISNYFSSYNLNHCMDSSSPHDIKLSPCTIVSICRAWCLNTHGFAMLTANPIFSATCLTSLCHATAASLVPYMLKSNFATRSLRLSSSMVSSGGDLYIDVRSYFGRKNMPSWHNLSSHIYFA